jgi:Domain of unknown function (DUF4431)
MIRVRWSLSLGALLVPGVLTGCSRCDRSSTSKPLEVDPPSRAAVGSGQVSHPGLVAGLPSPVASIQRPAPPVASGPALQAALRQMDPFPGTPSGGFTVPPIVRSTLRQLKDALLETLDAASPVVFAPGAGDQGLGEVYEHAGYTVSGGENEAWDEAAIAARLWAPKLHEHRRVVMLCVLLSPGTDCVLAVLEHQGERWTRRLVFRNDDYASMEGAVHNLYWKLSPPAKNGSFYVLVAHTHPWPASVWRGFSYGAFEPSANPNKPRALALGSDSGNWEQGYDLDARPDGFTVGFQIMAEDVAADFVTPARHEWRRIGGVFRRVHPAGATTRVAAPDCLHYEPTEVVLRGTLERATFPGPPNYRSVLDGDAAEEAWFLRLDQARCVEASPSDESNRAQARVFEIQLTASGQGGGARYEQLVGRPVEATGTLFGAHTGHHHSAVLLTVSELRGLSGP